MITKQHSGCGAPLYHMRDGDGALVVRVNKQSLNLNGHYRCSNCGALKWLYTGKTEEEFTDDGEKLRWL